MSEPLDPEMQPTKTENLARPGVNCWRDGSLLVLRRNTAFPGHCCAKCGEPAADPAQSYDLSWNPRWFDALWLAILLLSLAAIFLISPDLLLKGGVIFLVVMGTLAAWLLIGGIVWRSFRLSVPLCASHQWRESSTEKMVRIVGLFLLLGLMIVSWYHRSFSFLLGVCWVLWLLFAISPRSKREKFSAEKMDKECVYIKGCGEAFLASLPEFGRERQA